MTALATVADASEAGPAPGTITLTRTGDTSVPLTLILVGDVDVWTLDAAAGDRIGLHLGQITEGTDFRPWLRLWAPNGTVLGDTSGVNASAINGAVAPVTGTYFVLVASFDSFLDGTGTYRLTMTHTPGPITITPDDDGGAGGERSVAHRNDSARRCRRVDVHGQCRRADWRARRRND